HIRPLSNAITYFAQFFIKKTAQRLANQGVEVIYGDTDSVFVNTKTKDAQKAKEIGFTIQDDLNSFLQEYISTHYKRDSMLELEFEKQYLKFFLPNVRGDSSKGAKKRYAGLKIDAGKDLSKEKPVMDFTGLEFVRRDWTELSKEFQLTLLNKLFAEEPLEEYIKQFVADLKKGNYDDLLVYKKALRKKVEEYTKTTPPHVKAAKLLDKIEGSIISYVITTQGPQPIQKQTAPIDYNHYIEKQLRPIANSILELQNSSFDDVLKGSKQKGLGGFFLNLQVYVVSYTLAIKKLLVNLF
ncbi:MAG: DNA polymerase domain-containing protein, partial [Candidatus Nanoarchaeia archaeon]